MIQRKEQLILRKRRGRYCHRNHHRRFTVGYPVVILETTSPSAIRRQVALSEAVYDGESEVRGCDLHKGGFLGRSKRSIKRAKESASF